MANFLYIKAYDAYNEMNIYLNLEQIVTIQKMPGLDQNREYLIYTSTGASGFYVDKNEVFRIMQALGISLND